MKINNKVNGSKRTQIVMREVDRTAYDPKTGKCKSLPDGKPVVLKVSKKNKKPRALTAFEKLIGFRLDYDNQRNAFYRILEDVSKGRRVDQNDKFTTVFAPVNEEFLIGCHSVLVQILLEKKLIDNTICPHYPELTKNGVKAFKLLKKEL